MIPRLAGSQVGEEGGDLVVVLQSDHLPAAACSRQPLTVTLSTMRIVFGVGRQTARWCPAHLSGGAHG
jgi:hypothetical protein